MTISSLALARQRFSIGGLPVVDAAGRPVGMISRTDLFEAARGRLHDPVSSLMMSFAFVLPISASLADAAALMVNEHMHRVPIVVEGGELVGLLTTFDLARWLARTAGRSVPGQRAWLDAH